MIFPKWAWAVFLRSETIFHVTNICESPSSSRPADLANMTDTRMPLSPLLMRAILCAPLLLVPMALVQAQALKPIKPRVPNGLSMPAGEPAVNSKALTPEPPKALDFIVAVVDNEPITNLEVNRLAAMADPAAAKMSRNALLMEVLETLIDETAQLGLARQVGIQVSPEELDKAVAATAQRNQLSLDDMRQRLTEQGISWEQYRGQIRRQIMLQRVREREVTGRIKIQDFEVDAFLRESKLMQTSTNADIHIAHILIEVPEKANADELAKLLTKSDELLTRVKAGEDFGKLAAQFSQAPDRANGGQLGLRSPDRYPSLFADAVKSLPVGAVTGPIRSGAGFHILKLLERRSADALPASVSQTHARHILLRPGGKLSQDAARAQLATYKKQIETGLAKFDRLKLWHHHASIGPAQVARSNGRPLGVSFWRAFGASD
ncbi:MAG: molecular chaperone SurA [Betaproteobacteria bacterium]|nr:molecular chaperone SurA [Betaproteobacteria bacterium]